MVGLYLIGSVISSESVGISTMRLGAIAILLFDGIGLGQTGHPPPPKKSKHCKQRCKTNILITASTGQGGTYRG